MKQKDLMPDQGENGAMEPETRRGFLQKAGVMGGGMVALSAVPSLGQGARTERERSVPLSQARRILARRTRIEAALAQTSVQGREAVANPDEREIGGFLSSFTKGLPHNEFGEVEESAFRKLRTALETNQRSDWDSVPLVGPRKLVNPGASVALSLVGGDSHSFFMPPAPRFSSRETAAEMGEVYAHALLRDLPFDAYQETREAQLVAEEMNRFSDFRGPKVNGRVTPGSLFRGSFVGELTGPYVSQFLLMDVPMGSGDMIQRYETSEFGDDHMLTQEEWLHVLQGGRPAATNQYVVKPRFLETARDLGEFVHRDYSFQAYHQAALLLLGSGAPLHPNNPYNDSRTQEGFVTFGAVEILSMVAEACRLGMKAAWYQKWQVHRRLRPEVFGGRVHFVRQARKDYPIHSELLNSRILDVVEENFDGNSFLPMAYPEGSPVHPAYPAGHAVMAGAGVTILKALFDIDAVIENPVQVKPRSNARRLEAYTGDQLTIEGELNKLASNIAIGRNLAGVHWRTDGTEGILLGEAVAVRMLKDHKQTYQEDYESYRFRGFRGDQITI